MRGPGAALHMLRQPPHPNPPRQGERESLRGWGQFSDRQYVVHLETPVVRTTVVPSPFAGDRRGGGSAVEIHLNWECRARAGS